MQLAEILKQPKFLPLYEDPSGIPSRDFKFKIDLKPEARPKNIPAYKTNPMEMKAVAETLAALSKRGWITKAKDNSEWASPVIMIKQGDKYRFCVDYRWLNNNTLTYIFALPNVDNLIMQLGDNTHYSSLDLSKMFHQIECEAGSRKYLNFNCPFLDVKHILWKIV